MAVLLALATLAFNQSKIMGEGEGGWEEGS